MHMWERRATVEHDENIVGYKHDFTGLANPSHAIISTVGEVWMYISTVQTEVHVQEGDDSG